MWMFYLLSLLAVVAATREKIGYFWHVTDIHYDVSNKKGCAWPEYERNGGPRSQKRPVGRFGDYGCDSPWELIQSAANLMKSRQDVDFVLWTGDAMSHESREHQTEAMHLNVLTNLTLLLESTFVYHSIYPALGHDDPHSKKKVAELWRKWLPFDDKTKPFEKGGYYLIERKSKVPLLLVLNTNLMKIDARKEAAEEQWNWLENALRKMKENGEKVFLVGHIPPGSSDRLRGAYTRHIAYSDVNNKRYINLTQEYANIIVGQFFGHLHSDTFRVIYNKDQPVSWAMIAPAVSPRLSNNPALRLYKYSRDSGQVLDYTQFFLNLSHVNSNANEEEAKWDIEYVFTERYGIQSITARSLHDLAEKITQFRPNGNPTFKSYYQANFVSNSPQLVSCDSNCIHSHYCAITKVDYKDYELCLKTPASALSASSTVFGSAPLCVILSITVLLWKM